MSSDRSRARRQLTAECLAEAKRTSDSRGRASLLEMAQKWLDLAERSEHEAWKEFILCLVFVLCEELNLNLQSYGGTTWKRKQDLRGTEADTCFYVATAERVIGKREIDLAVDPPPEMPPSGSPPDWRRE